MASEQNLEIVSEASRKADKPMWGFCLAVAHDPTPSALQHLRIQAFSNLAYGAQAIQYFTYWTMKSDTWNFHEGPVGLDGKPAPSTPNRVKQVSQDRARLSLLGSEVLSIGHTDPISAGTRFNRRPRQVSAIRRRRRDLHLEKATANSSPSSTAASRGLPLKVTLHALNGIDRVEKIGEVHPMTGAIRTAGLPGDVFILSWRRSSFQWHRRAARADGGTPAPALFPPVPAPAG